MENYLDKSALGTYDDISRRSLENKYLDKFNDSIQSSLSEKVKYIQKQDLFFILSVTSIAMFVVIYFLLFLFK